ncbi:uncharacterized protein BDZ83DRAFT_622211, partial [Colletotrichum acutatum]
MKHCTTSQSWYDMGKFLVLVSCLCPSATAGCSICREVFLVPTCYSSHILKAENVELVHNYFLELARLPVVPYHHLKYIPQYRSHWWREALRSV